MYWYRIGQALKEIVKWEKKDLQNSVYTMLQFGLKCVCIHFFLAYNIPERILTNSIPSVVFERKVTWWIGNRNEGKFSIK